LGTKNRHQPASGSATESGVVTTEPLVQPTGASSRLTRGRSSPAPRALLVGLGLLVIAGAVLRLHDLGQRAFRQDEIFVPGLALPAGVSSPEPMLTPIGTVKVLLRDVHPPSWYVGMLYWTRLAGTTLFAIRLPSAVFGVLAIVLTYWVATLETDRKTALLGAAFLTFNGHHLLTSQIARPYAMLCCLGLCSTGALLLSLRAGPRQTAWGVVYAVAILAGLSIHHYFWPLFLAQVAWVLGKAWVEKTRLHGLLRLQFLVVILSAPLATMAVFQSRNSYLQAYLSHGVLDFFSGFVRFAFLFEPDGKIVRPIPPTVAIALLVLSLLLLARGLIRLTQRYHEAAVPQDLAGPSPSMLTAAAIVSCVAVLAATVLFHDKEPGRTLLHLSTMTIALVPLGIVMRLGRAQLIRVEPSPQHYAPRRRDWPLIVWLAVGPALFVALVTLSVRPFLASRGMVVYSPYLLMVLAAGVVAVARARFGTALVTAIAIPLAVGHVVSARDSYKKTTVQDYEGLAAQWVTELQDQDVVFAPKDWETAPVYYFLDLRRYRFVGRDFDAYVQRWRPARVWVLLPEDAPIPEDIVRSLRGFTRARVLRAPRLQAQLHVSAAP
jgi:hypothetical protein